MALILAILLLIGSVFLIVLGGAALYAENFHGVFVSGLGVMLLTYACLTISTAVKKKKRHHKRRKAVVPTQTPTPVPQRIIRAAPLTA